jgi:hypothetical protein
MKRFSQALILAAVTAFGAGSAQATVIYSTGANNAANGSVDANWTITASTGTSPAPGPAYVATYTPGTFPFTYWSAPIAGSQWITPTTDPAASFDPNANGLYTFSETFTGTAGSVIRGSYLSDNTVTSITLQPSTEVLSGGGGFTAPASSFSFAPLAQTGTYTLAFTVENFAQNGGNPFGLDVSVSAVPEASTWAMMILGFLGLGFLGYRKSSKASGQSFRIA